MLSRILKSISILAALTAAAQADGLVTEVKVRQQGDAVKITIPASGALRRRARLLEKSVVVDTQRPSNKGFVVTGPRKSVLEMTSSLRPLAQPEVYPTIQETVDIPSGELSAIGELMNGLFPDVSCTLDEDRGTLVIEGRQTPSNSLRKLSTK